MDELKAVGIAEGTSPASEQERIEAFQYLVDTGIAWQCGGKVGVEAFDLVVQGKIKRGGYKGLFEEKMDNA